MKACKTERVFPGSTFFLRLCRCCCPSWVFPRRSGKASGFRERERGVLGYLNGSVSLESRPLRTEQSDRERMRPDEWMLLTPIIVVSLEFRGAFDSRLQSDCTFKGRGPRRKPKERKGRPPDDVVYISFTWTWKQIWLHFEDTCSLDCDPALKVFLEAWEGAQEVWMWQTAARSGVSRQNKPAGDHRVRLLQDFRSIQKKKFYLDNCTLSR